MTTSPAGHRLTPRRDIELIAICEDYLGVGGPGVSVTVAKVDGLLRRVIPYDGTIAGLARAVRQAADWISCGAAQVEGVRRVA